MYICNITFLCEFIVESWLLATQGFVFWLFNLKLLCKSYALETLIPSESIQLKK